MDLLKKYKAYLADNPEGYWFKRRLYGWGWTPATWQGWTVVFVYVALVLTFAFTLDESSPQREVVFTFFLPLALLTFALIRVMYRTGEKPKWQWGLPEEEKEEK